MAETVKDYSGACWNALIEEETKESIARLYIDSLDASRAEKADVAELVEALKAVTTDLSELYSFCDDAKRPCGEYGVECPIAMGEWISNSERATLVHARALLAKHASPRDAT